MATSSTLSPAIAANLSVIKQGVTLVRTLGTDRYLKRVEACYNSSVGGHLRHIIEHYQSFLTGLGPDGIDYENRARDARIENTPEYAGEILEVIAGQLEAKCREKEHAQLRLCSETAPGIYSTTSVLRELEFLLSHTIHHYALIAVMVRLQGFEPEAAFGIAPSTLRYQQTQVTCAR